MKEPNRKSNATKVASGGAVELTADAFETMSDEEKQRIYDEIDQTPPAQLLAESRPLNVKERGQWRAINAKLARRP